ncbi:hypothetical protein [Marinifilum fragile]|uniref:hypothetical protein n=1 Tax=Marinifilum fragile TaxID=570161 RepID=UPI002AA622EA|nr:hypothetical protein [Marinifilum fragile]
MIKKKLTPIKFHFFSLTFKPYIEIENQYNSNKVLNEVITFISQEKQAGRGFLIDKNRNRTNEVPRELFMTSAVIMHRERRIRCSIALLRSGRIPKIKPKNQFLLLPLGEMGTIAEETHFFIDFSTDKAIICVEYNNYGPRIKDIEYYLRSIARYKLKLSKATEVIIYMNSSIDKTLKDLKNVLNLDIKLQPKNIAQMDKDIVGQYFTGMNSIGNNLKPKFLKLEAMYQAPGQKITSQEINSEANSMVTTMLKKFKSRPLNIDLFDNFVVKYEDEVGKEAVFNLLNEKKEIIKQIDLSTIRKKREFYEIIENDFDEFIQMFRNA